LTEKLSSDAARHKTAGHSRGEDQVGPRRDHRGFACIIQRSEDADIGVERPPPSRGRPYRRSTYGPASLATGGLLPPSRALHCRPGSSSADCPARRPGRGSWRSVHRASARSPGPRRHFFGGRRCIGGAPNGTIDHRIFVVGIYCEILKHPFPDTAFGPTVEARVHFRPVDNRSSPFGTD
jgi:hypothetical protein